MYSIERYIDVFETYKLGDDDTFIKVVPDRGGIITSFFYKGKMILYLEPETLYDVSKNIRGGIPVLFPICGWLQDECYKIDGISYNMPQHGLARRAKWTVIDSFVGEHGVDMTLCFKSNEQTKKSYPFDFRLIYRYELTDNGLAIHQSYINDSDKDMPFYAGFHPYFYTSDKTALAFDTGALHFWDSVDGRLKDIKDPNNIDFSAPEVNMILLDAHARGVSMTNKADGWVVSLNYDDIFKYVVIWSLEGKNFVCIEPWMARPDSMNTRRDVHTLCSHGILNTTFNINCELI
ncbi:aldose epimerase [Mahella sp.]|uniref:aldose epimerase family protein n=1 Tax=Mahella sp. TaxID=2798721 RepID=UPI0025BB092D|nr:aldose epimerase [Mahella sp.]MBZ4666061.1 Aldose 1-epimerase [Mahella sp.]